MSRSEKNLLQSRRDELFDCRQCNRINVLAQYTSVVILGCLLPSLVSVPLYGVITKPGDSGEAQGQLIVASTESVSQKQTSIEMDHLALARLYAEAGKIDDALKAYSKAMESHDPKIRAAALGETEVLLARRNRFFSWLMVQAKVIGKGAFLVILVVLLWIIALLFRTVVCWAKRACHVSKIEVRPFRFSPSSNSTYDHFREILAVMRERVQHQRCLTERIDILQAETVIPTVQSRTFTERLEAPMAAIAPRASAVLTWLLRSLNPPRFTVEGSVGIDDKAYSIVVKILQDSHLKKILERSIQRSELTEGLKDIAYEVLVLATMD